MQSQFFKKEGEIFPEKFLMSLPCLPPPNFTPLKRKKKKHSSIDLAKSLFTNGRSCENRAGWWQTHPPAPLPGPAWLRATSSKGNQEA